MSENKNKTTINSMDTIAKKIGGEILKYDSNILFVDAKNIGIIVAKKLKEDGVINLNL